VHGDLHRDRDGAVRASIDRWLGIPSYDYESNADHTLC
jgi:hypothetical protein